MSKNKVRVKFKVISKFEPSRDQEKRLEKVYEIASFSQTKVVENEIEEDQEDQEDHNNQFIKDYNKE